MTTIFFATDVHGADSCFKKFLKAADFYKADVLILGGDVSGKVLIPLIEQSDGTYRVNFAGTEITANTREELEKIEEQARFVGYYPFRTDPHEYEDLTNDKEKVSSLTMKLILERLRNWIVTAQEFLRDKQVKCYVTGGNDDPYEIEDILKASENPFDPEGQVVEIAGSYQMISCSYSNHTPWKTPRELSEEDLTKTIEKMCEKIGDFKNAIFNFHVPPFDSLIDSAPKLDVSVFPPKPILKGGVVFVPVGSTAVRAAIEKYQPLLGLHGHIHESRGKIRLGRTLCLNPGSSYGEGTLLGALVKLEDGKVKTYQLTSG